MQSSCTNYFIDSYIMNEVYSN